MMATMLTALAGGRPIAAANRTAIAVRKYALRLEDLDIIRSRVLVDCFITGGNRAGISKICIYRQPWLRLRPTTRQIFRCALAFTSSGQTTHFPFNERTFHRFRLSVARLPRRLAGQRSQPSASRAHNIISAGREV